MDKALAVTAFTFDRFAGRLKHQRGLTTKRGAEWLFGPTEGALAKAQNGE